MVTNARPELVMPPAPAAPGAELSEALRAVGFDSPPASGPLPNGLTFGTLPGAIPTAGCTTESLQLPTPPETPFQGPTPNSFMVPPTTVPSMSQPLFINRQGKEAL